MNIAQRFRDRARGLAVERRVGALLRSPRTARLVTRLITATGALHERLGEPAAWHDATWTRGRLSSQSLRAAIDSARRLASLVRSLAPRPGVPAGESRTGSGPAPVG